MPPTFELTIEVGGLPPAKGNEAPLSADHPHLQRTTALLQAVRSLLPSGFRPLSTSVGLDLTLRTPSARQAWDATNYLGGIADVLQNKYRRELAHLGELGMVSVYENDRVIREVRYQHERSETVSYRLRIWTLDRPDLEGPIGANPEDLSVEPRPARSPELCINFVNTFMKASVVSEKLGSYRDLLRWGQEEGLVTLEIVDLLQLVASLRATEAENVTIRSRRFREAIRSVLLAERSVDDLEHVSATLQRYLPLRSLRWLDGKVQCLAGSNRPRTGSLARRSVDTCSVDLGSTQSR